MASDAELLDAAVADPHAARLVYADHLIQNNDPRGRFIALQCARAGAGGVVSADHDREERGLLRAHWKKWIADGGARYARSVGFSRGFWSSHHIDTTFNPSTALADPAWRTVEMLAFPPQFDLVPFLAAPALRQLREVRVRGQAHVDLLADPGCPIALETLGVYLPTEPALELRLQPSVRRLRFECQPTPASALVLVRWLARVAIPHVEIHVSGDSHEALPALGTAGERCPEIGELLVRARDLDLIWANRSLTLRWTRPIVGRGDLRDLMLLIRNVQPKTVEVAAPPMFDEALGELAASLRVPIGRCDPAPPPIEIYPAG